MSDPMFPLVMAAAELKVAAPEAYEKFITAFKGFEAKVDADFKAADPNVIFPAQGKAQLVTQLRTKLEQCFDLRSKYEARK